MRQSSTKSDRRQKRPGVRTCSAGNAVAQWSVVNWLSVVVDGWRLPKLVCNRRSGVLRPSFGALFCTVTFSFYVEELWNVEPVRADRCTAGVADHCSRNTALIMHWHQCGVFHNAVAQNVPTKDSNLIFSVWQYWSSLVGSMTNLQLRSRSHFLWSMARLLYLIPKHLPFSPCNLVYTLCWLFVAWMWYTSNDNNKRE